MAKTNAQRQADYRVRHFKDEGKGKRLNLVLDLHANCALERLAFCYGVTQREILDRLLRQAEGDVADPASPLPNGLSDYYEKHRRLAQEFVTP